MAVARALAQAYVKMYLEKKTWSRPRLSQNDYRQGWMCYQWQTHTYNALESIVKSGKCFDIRRVGLVKQIPGENPNIGNFRPVYGPYIPAHLSLEHNWVAISVPTTSGHVSQRAPVGKNTIYLDPWIGEGASVYSFIGPGYEDNHPIHNFIGTDYEGDESKPTGINGWYIPSNGSPCQTGFNGWTW